MRTTGSGGADLLIATARGTLSGEQNGLLRAPVPEEADLSAAVEAALFHGTAPLLCHHLLSSAHSHVSADFTIAAETFLAERAEATQRGLAELFQLLEAMNASGVAAIPIKGPALAARAYDALHLRPFRDLDFLIQERDIDRAFTILAELGYYSRHEHVRVRHRTAYHRYNGQDILFAAGRLPVEPHWTFAPWTYAAHLPISEIWERAEEQLLAGRRIPALSTEDSLVVAAVHGAKEQWSRLIWLVDVAELIKRYPALDWDITLKRATHSGLRRIFLLSLCLANTLLGAPLPKQISSVIDRDAPCAALAAQIRGRLVDRPPPVSVFDISRFQWRARERLHDRLRYLARTLLTPRMEHFGLLDLPDRLAFAYPVVKLAHGCLALPAWTVWKKLRP